MSLIDIFICPSTLELLSDITNIMQTSFCICNAAIQGLGSQYFRVPGAKLLIDLISHIKLMNFITFLGKKQ